MIDASYRYQEKSSKKKLPMLLIVIVIGAILGVIAKQGDVAHQGTAAGNLLYAVGLVTSGFFIWTVACIIISLKSDRAAFAAINVLGFLASMLLTYYLYSHYAVGYLVTRVVKFWALALIPSAVLSALVYKAKSNKFLRYVVLIIATLVMLVDILYWQGGVLIAIVIDLILYAVLLAVVKRLDGEPATGGGAYPGSP